jgi:hypothetical protein
MRAVHNAIKQALRMSSIAVIRNALERALQMCTIVHERNAPPAKPRACPGSRPWWRERTGHQIGCVICGGNLPKVKTRYGWDRVASHRMFCKNACRQRAYRIMHSPTVLAEVRARKEG